MCGLPFREPRCGAAASPELGEQRRDSTRGVVRCGGGSKPGTPPGRRRHQASRRYAGPGAAAVAGSGDLVLEPVGNVLKTAETLVFPPAGLDFQQALELG